MKNKLTAANTMHVVKTKQNPGLNFKAFRQAVQNLLYITTLVRETFLVFLSTGVGFYERLVHICTVASHQFFLLFGFWYERKWPPRGRAPPPLPVSEQSLVQLITDRFRPCQSKPSASQSTVRLHYWTHTHTH